MQAQPRKWLLLIHQLPAKPAYPRVKVWRRLQTLGAVAVKNAVYALPAGEQAREDFEWLLKEIAELGGEGMIFEARLVDGLSDEDVCDAFNAARAADYDALSKEARALAAATGSEGSQAEARAKLARLRTEVARIAAIDFFGANGREAVEGLLSGVEARLKEAQAMAEDKPDPAPVSVPGDTLKGQVWVTRRGVYVDRIACAWLIRRFIDPEARFRFVPARDYVPAPGELRFDMYNGEFTHEGDRCSFEVLLARTGLSDPALVRIGEIVHDIDLKDGKFGREEAGGVAALLDGLCQAEAADERRIERGGLIFDDLYAAFRKRRGS